MTTLKLKSPVPFPASVSGTGGISVSKSSGNWLIQPDFAALASIAGTNVSDPTSKQVWIYDPTTGDYNVLTLAGLGDALYSATSTTSLAIAKGSTVFTTQSGKDFGIGSFVLATSDANPTNYMLGQVKAYADATLTISVTTVGGSGTHADWTLRATSAAGEQGRSAGHSYLWNTATGASDPGSGNIAANNATISSATALYISETDHDGNSLAAVIATWDDSTSAIHGRLKIYDPVIPQNYAIFDVTGTNTDNGTYDTINVTYVGSGGTLANSLAVYAQFTPKGDKGDTGPVGNSTFSGVTTHGVLVGTGTNTATSTAAMTDGQLLVGQTGGDPLPKTISGDATLSASGALTLVGTRSVNTQTGTTYTFVLTDNGKLVTLSNAAAITATVPPNSSVAFPIGTQIDVVQTGAGKVTLAQGAGVTINSVSSNKSISAQYAGGTLLKIATDTWLLTGSLIA